MPPPLRSSELYDGSFLGPEMATIQVISGLILVLGFDVFHFTIQSRRFGAKFPKDFQTAEFFTADACQIYSSSALIQTADMNGMRKTRASILGSVICTLSNRLELFGQHQAVAATSKDRLSVV